MERNEVSNNFDLMKSNSIFFQSKRIDGVAVAWLSNTSGLPGAGQKHLIEFTKRRPPRRNTEMSAAPKIPDRIN